MQQSWLNHGLASNVSENFDEDFAVLLLSFSIAAVLHMTRLSSQHHAAEFGEKMKNGPFPPNYFLFLSGDRKSFHHFPQGDGRTFLHCLEDKSPHSGIHLASGPSVWHWKGTCRIWMGISKNSLCKNSYFGFRQVQSRGDTLYLEFFSPTMVQDPP